MAGLNPKLIFDIGVSEGNDTAYYLAKGFDVVGVEADPVVFAGLNARFRSECLDGHLTLVNAAASDAPGRIVPFLHNDVHQGISGFRPHPHVPDGYSVYTVTTVTWHELRSLHGVPYFCKVDIEGQETLFLKNLIGEPTLPTFISVECHTLDPVALLYALGYRNFKLIDQQPPGGFQNVYPPLEGNYVEQPNWHHASGPFGNELPGDRWLSFEEFINAFHASQPERYRTWFDCHACIPPVTSA